MAKLFMSDEKLAEFLMEHSGDLPGLPGEIMVFASQRLASMAGEISDWVKALDVAQLQTETITEQLVALKEKYEPEEE
jgi:hypothetical protein